MRDQLTFSTQRQGNHIAALCRGQDRDGADVNFAIAAETLRRNSHLQDEWASQVLAAEHVYCGLTAQGMDPDAAWTLAEPLLPRALTITTGWIRSPLAVDDAVANDGHELGQGGDDILGQSLDG